MHPQIQTTPEIVPPTRTRTHTHACTHARTHTHTRAQARAHTRTHTNKHTHTHTHTHTHPHTRTHARTHTHAHRKRQLYIASCIQKHHFCIFFSLSSFFFFLFSKLNPISIFSIHGVCLRTMLIHNKLVTW